MTNPTPANVKFVKTNTVFVATTSVELNITNPVKVIQPATTGTTPNTPVALNFNKPEYRFTVSGWINQGKLDASETYTDAQDKKNGLITMFIGGGTIAFTYEGTTYTVMCDKLSIKDSVATGTTPGDNEAVYDVQLTLIKSA